MGRLAWKIGLLARKTDAAIGLNILNLLPMFFIQCERKFAFLF